MKKMFVKSLFVGAMLTCGSASMNAQSVLDSVLGSFAGAVTGNSGTSSDDTKSSILSGLSTIFSNSKVATADKIVDASRLLKFAGVVGNLSGNTMLKTAGSLLSGMDGMECGVRLVKK